MEILTVVLFIIALLSVFFSGVILNECPDKKEFLFIFIFGIMCFILSFMFFYASINGYKAICPKCSQSYTKESQLYCEKDGEKLIIIRDTNGNYVVNKNE